MDSLGRKSSVPPMHNGEGEGPSERVIGDKRSRCCSLAHKRLEK